MALQWIEVADYEAMSCEGAARLVAAIENGLRQSRPVTVGLATGNTMISLYEKVAEAINRRGVDLSQLHTFNLDEYIGSDGRWVAADHPLSYHAYMDRQLFRRLDPKLRMDPSHIHFPDPANPAGFDAEIRRLGGLDFQLLGIGFNGHIAFNEPMSPAEISAEAFAALPTRVIDLTETTLAQNTALTAGGDRRQVPRRAITMGMGSILAAREILLLACFAEQREPLRRIRQEGVSPQLPASYLLNHPNATIIATEKDWP